MRDLLLRSLVFFGVAAALLTEALSVFHWLRPVPLAFAWTGIVIALVWKVRVYAAHIQLPRPRPLEALIGGAIAAIVGIVAVTAWLSPPNSADAMAYHMPRVLYWAQSGSVAFFPTSYFNQVMLQPLAEYLMLHTYLLTGGDRFVNLITCGAFAGCIAGVSAIAWEMGLSSRAQAFVALACATLPNAILQASGAKNDMLLALWLVCAVYFAVRREAKWLGFAVGLALATKGTAYLFLPPMLLALGVWRRREIAWMAAGVLLINTPQYVRNLRLSGSPLGFDSAQGDGFFRWRNERLGWRPLVTNVVSNALRHASEQLGARSDRWNRSVYDGVVSVHRALGLDPQDPDTTWRWARYEPPRNANHEANANNRWHLLLMVAAVLWALIRRNRRWSLYAAGIVGAFLLFCFYLKWQPFLARLELPLFVLSAVLVGQLVNVPGRGSTWLTVVLSVFLVNNARPALFENWTRPLKGPHSLWATSRDENYFRDMGQWDNRASYIESVDRVARSGCDFVGLDISRNTLEYPFQALLRERRPRVRFVHTDVPGTVERPCAVLCLDCAGDEKKAAMYTAFGSPIQVGHFLLYSVGIKP